MKKIISLIQSSDFLDLLPLKFRDLGSQWTRSTVQHYFSNDNWLECLPALKLTPVPKSSLFKSVFINTGEAYFLSLLPFLGSVDVMIMNDLSASVSVHCEMMLAALRQSESRGVFVEQYLAKVDALPLTLDMIKDQTYFNLCKWKFKKLDFVDGLFYDYRFLPL